MDKASRINIAISEQMDREIKRLVGEGKFMSQAEYVRFAIEVDLEKRRDRPEP